MKRRFSWAVALAMLVGRTATAGCPPPPVPSVTLPPVGEVDSSPRETLAKLLPRLTVIARAPETLATLGPLDRPFGVQPDEVRWQLLVSWSVAPTSRPRPRERRDDASKVAPLVLAWRGLARQVGCPSNASLEARALDAVRLAELEAELDVVTQEAFSNARRPTAPEL